jgi:hypothetical protein
LIEKKAALQAQQPLNTDKTQAGKVAAATVALTTESMCIE